MGHFSVGFLFGLAAGVYAAQEVCRLLLSWLLQCSNFPRFFVVAQYDLPKAKYLYSMAMDKISNTEQELRKKSNESAARKD